MKDDPKLHKHTVKFKYTKTSDGYVAQCMEIPSIVVQGKSIQELKKELKSANTGYFKAFPQEHVLLFGNDNVKWDELTLEV